jgi:aldehyde:ferredoxin oxidoreductase
MEVGAMNGFCGRILTIDLSRKTFSIDPIGRDILETTLGGRGLAVHLLLEKNPPNVDPLAPENNLIFTTGPASGSPVWGSCRHGVFTKSPQTGFFSESYAGGTAAEYIGSTGFDAIVIHGKANSPVWLDIDEKGVVFHSADNLWGLDTFQTEDRVKARVKETRPKSGKCGVVCIGPAGENLVVFAVIENDYWRSAGRTGTGAVMGSKKIKAIAFKGSLKKSFADKQSLIEFSRTLAR